MHNPYKHIIVTEQTVPIFIDFERAHKTEKPQNVTQFCQYVLANKNLLAEKGLPVVDKKKMMGAAKEYKDAVVAGELKKKHLNEILKVVSGE